MGISYSTYLGPHVVCKTTKVPSVKKIRTCTNEACKVFHKEVHETKKKFCEHCGGAISNWDQPIEVDNVILHEVREGLLDEALYPPCGDGFHYWMRDNNTHLWLANRSVPGVRKFSFDSREDVQMVPITPELIADETTKFSDFFEKELFILREEYGAENVQVTWGLIHYAS